MSHMSEIDAEMETLREDVGALTARVIEEKEIADYWYERAMKAEGGSYDALND